eukprot:1339796-Amorphochlora_amoeboformis.AAC.1
MEGSKRIERTRDERKYTYLKPRVNQRSGRGNPCLFSFPLLKPNSHAPSLTNFSKPGRGWSAFPGSLESRLRLGDARGPTAVRWSCAKGHEVGRYGAERVG